MRQFKRMFVGMLFLMLAIGSASTALAQEMATPAVNGEITFTFVEQGVGEVHLDLGEPGVSVGDRYIFRNPIIDEASGQSIGHTAGTCDVTDVKNGAEQYYACSYLISLPDGVVAVTGEYDAVNGTADLFVVGGSGMYEGATGVCAYTTVKVEGKDWNLEFPTTLTITLAR
jgi:allene oxide cyclase-like protein